MCIFEKFRLINHILICNNYDNNNNNNNNNNNLKKEQILTISLSADSD